MSSIGRLRQRVAEGRWSSSTKRCDLPMYNALEDEHCPRVMAAVVRERRRMSKKKIEIGIKVQTNVDLKPLRAPASTPFLSSKPHSTIPNGTLQQDILHALRVSEIEIAKLAIIRSNQIREAKTLVDSVSHGLKHPGLDRLLDKLRQATIQIAIALKRRRLLLASKTPNIKNKYFWLAGSPYALTLLEDTDFLYDLRDQLDFVAGCNPLLLTEPHPGFADPNFSQEPHLLLYKNEHRMHPYYGDASDAEQELILELRDIPPDTVAAFHVARSAKLQLSSTPSLPPPESDIKPSAIIPFADLNIAELNLNPEAKKRVAFLRREIQRACNRRERAVKRLEDLETKCNCINQKLAFSTYGHPTSPSFVLAVQIAKLREQALAYDTDRRTHAAIVFREQQDINRRAQTCEQILARSSSSQTTSSKVQKEFDNCLAAPCILENSSTVIENEILVPEMVSATEAPEQDLSIIPDIDTTAAIWTPPDAIINYEALGRDLIESRLLTLRTLRQFARRAVVSEKLRAHGRRAKACATLRTFALRAAVDYDRFHLQPYYNLLESCKEQKAS